MFKFTNLDYFLWMTLLLFSCSNVTKNKDMLHKAVIENDSNTVSNLIESGVDPTMRDNNGLTALGLVKYIKRTDKFKGMLSEFRDLNNKLGSIIVCNKYGDEKCNCLKMITLELSSLWGPVWPRYTNSNKCDNRDKYKRFQILQNNINILNRIENKLETYTNQFEEKEKRYWAEIANTMSNAAPNSQIIIGNCYQGNYKCKFGSENVNDCYNGNTFTKTIKINSDNQITNNTSVTKKDTNINFSLNPFKWIGFC
ncbi:MAG: ankyrin repeat domain-containing protein [Bacteroidetes bacterium]|nr:ankyrin repeat domain-containing protein [Bacteroidota bacterium]